MTFGIHDLRPAPGSTHKRKRVGRGRSSGHGKTCGRGMKGEKARGKIRQSFEGGQMPLQRRLPKLKGFKPLNRVEYQLVNVGRLNLFADGDTVDLDRLLRCGLVRREDLPVKVLGSGELERKLTVRAHAFTAGARAKIEARGGSAEEV